MGIKSVMHIPLKRILRPKINGGTFRGSNSVIVITAFLLNGGKLFNLLHSGLSECNRVQGNNCFSLGADFTLEGHCLSGNDIRNHRSYSPL